MGKPTGFLEYERISNKSVEPNDRIKNFSEFHSFLAPVERRKQAARCMNCGVPFCQSGENFGGMFSGCPLHNLIPEWNDEIYKGHTEEALSRLLKTNNFPEFTGRVCPALCEAACTCGMNGDPVSVHDNELFIIENAYANGLIKACPPKQRTGKKIAVIGSGPSGLAAADQLNKRGHLVTVFERSPRPGGLLMYGIPNMKLDKKVISRKIDIMKKEGVEFICNTDIGKDVSAEKILSDFDSVILCCGSKTPRDLNVEGRDASGVYFAVDFLSSATEKVIGDASTFRINAKDKNVIIVGGGDTGNDCVGTAVRQKCKSVTQIEMMPKLPDLRSPTNPWPQWPRICKTDYGQEEAAAVFGADPRIYQTTVKKINKDSENNIISVVAVNLKSEFDKKTCRNIMTEVKGSEKELPCDLLLIAAGFVGCEKYISSSFGVETDIRGNIKSPDGKYSTNVPCVFTAGDAHRGQSLVVWAISEGRNCAEEVDGLLI